MSSDWIEIAAGALSTLVIARWDGVQAETWTFYYKPTKNIIIAIAFKNNYQFQYDDGVQLDADLTFSVTKDYVYKASNNVWDGISNPWDWIQNHGNYSTTPKPESTTTLYTPFNFQARFIMADNLESNIANLNDLSGAVHVLNSDFHILQSEIDQIESQIEGIAGLLKMLSSDVETMQIVMIAGEESLGH
jgi:hypothetical protein